MRIGTRSLLLALSLTALLFATNARGAGDSLFTFGINWMLTDPRLDSGRVKTLFDSTMGCNLYHQGDWLNTRVANGDTVNNIIGWSKHSPAQVMIANYDGAIYAYSGGKRATWDARNDRIAGPDSLKHFYFGEHSVGAEYLDPLTNLKHWEVLDSTAHTTRCVLSASEFPTDWRAPSGQRFYAAVKAQVAAIDTSSIHDALTVTVIHYHRSLGTRDTFLTHIPWNVFHAANKDRLVLDTAGFTLTRQFDWHDDSLLCEVWSERYVTARIASVTIEDEHARDLLTYRDMGGTDTVSNNFTSWLSTRTTIESLVSADSAYINAHIQKPGGGSNIKYICIMDEPPVSELACAGEVNAMIGYRGNTEWGIPNLRRFLAFVKPPALWTGAIVAGAGNQISAITDAGLDQGRNPALPFDACTVWRGTDDRRLDLPSMIR